MKAETTEQSASTEANSTTVALVCDPKSLIVPAGGRDSEPAATFHSEPKVIALP